MKAFIRLFSKMFEGLKSSMATWKQKVKTLKLQTYTIYLAYKDPRVPWHAKLLAILVVGYAFSPIDLIPDFIPILGYLDDLILVPLGIKLVMKLIPNEVFSEYQAKAAAEFKGKPKAHFAPIVIILIWCLALVWFGSILWQMTNKHH